jgi:C1A family cysteine protease
MTCAYGEYIDKNLTMPLVNHAVSIVGWGYNETYDSEYFLIKNSFGT